VNQPSCPCLTDLDDDGGLPNPLCYYTLSDITGGLVLWFPIVIVIEALRVFPQIGDKPFLIQNDKPLKSQGEMVN